MSNEAEKNGGSAFPALEWWPDHGMSLRDWFAGQIAAGIVSAPKGSLYGDVLDNQFRDGHKPPSEIALYAYEIADFMLAERSKAEGRT